MTPDGSGADVAPSGDVGPSAPTTLDPALAGSGFVSIHVRLPAVGVDETISLDRALVHADALDPVSLDATCTTLDGGDGLSVSVVDLRRLGAGSRLVSAALRVDGRGDARRARRHARRQRRRPGDDALHGHDRARRRTRRRARSRSPMPPAPRRTAASCAPRKPPATTTTAPPAGGGEDVPDSVPATTG